MKAGRPPNYAVRLICNRFGVSKRVARLIPIRMLVNCKDNAAIRLLLGISR